MDDIIGFVIVVGTAFCVVITASFIGWGTMDSMVIKACEARGYWQTGQTRVICSVEKAK